MYVIHACNLKIDIDIEWLLRGDGLAQIKPVFFMEYGAAYKQVYATEHFTKARNWFKKKGLCIYTYTAKTIEG